MNRRAFLKSAAIGAVVASGLPAVSEWLTPLAPCPELAAGGIGLEVGDMFTISGYYATNPVTGRATPHLLKFVVTAVSKDDVQCVPAHFRGSK